MSDQANSPIKMAAQTLGISDKRMRGFIRSEHRNGRTIKGFVPVGQGNRYDAKDVKAAAKLLVSTFVKAHPSHKMPKAHAPRKPRNVTPAVTPETPETPAVDVTPEA